MGGETSSSYILTCPAAKDIAAGPFGLKPSGPGIKNYNRLRAPMQAVLIPRLDSFTLLFFWDRPRATSRSPFLLGNAS